MYAPGALLPMSRLRFDCSVLVKASSVSGRRRASRARRRTAGLRPAASGRGRNGCRRAPRRLSGRPLPRLICRAGGPSATLACGITIPAAAKETVKTYAICFSVPFIGTGAESLSLAPVVSQYSQTLWGRLVPKIFCLLFWTYEWSIKGR